ACAMCEWKGALAGVKCGQHTVVRNAAESQHRFKPIESADAAAQKSPARGDLPRGWLVLGRHASDRIGDHATVEGETISRVGAVRPRRESKGDQRLIEQLTGEIASERP